MKICHRHNLNWDPEVHRRFGIRVKLQPTDPFQRLVGSDFERLHWYPTATERDRALRDMAAEHLYSRRGDRPTLSFEPLDRG